MKSDLAAGSRHALAQITGRFIEFSRQQHPFPHVRPCDIDSSGILRAGRARSARSLARGRVEGVNGLLFFYLAYCSRAAKDFGQVDIDDVLAVARRNNSLQHITGCLVYSRGILLNGSKEP
jgi:hypothetical protein